MKKAAAIIGAILVVVVLLGFLFVRWANQPENVAALQQHRAEEAQQKKESAEAEAAAKKEWDAKTATLVPVIEETFAHNRFEKLDYTLSGSSQFQLKENEFRFNTLLTNGQNAYEYFVLSREDFGDFAAETEFGVWGTTAMVGIVWDATPRAGKNPSPYRAAYSTPNYLTLSDDGTETFGLGGLISAENNQKLRVERLGRRIKITVNGKILVDREMDTGKGKVGIYIAHGSGTGHPGSVSIAMKNFRVFAPIGGRE